MKRVTFTLKQALAAATVTGGLTAGVAFAAPHIFGTTEVAGSGMTRGSQAAVVPQAPALTPPTPAASHPASDGTAASESGRPQVTQPSPRPGDRPTPPAGPASPGQPPSAGQTPPERSAPSGPGSFAITGDVTGMLYPGGAAELRVTMRNPYAFPIEIVSAAVSIGDAGDCAARHLWIDGEPPTNGVTRLPAAQRIPAGGEVEVSVPAQLRNSAGDKCRNARFPLSYLGKAVRA